MSICPHIRVALIGIVILLPAEIINNLFVPAGFWTNLFYTWSGIAYGVVASLVVFRYNIEKLKEELKRES